MGKIPTRGFITRLYSATIPTVSRYGKKKIVEVNHLEHLRFLFEPRSLSKYEYEFFLEHFARGIHYYS